MISKNVLFAFFLAVCIVQLFFPAKMIFDSADVLKEGNLYKFKVVPVDPTDILRGKYIILGFEADQWNSSEDPEVVSNTEIFVLLKADPMGFAAVKSIQYYPPEDTEDFVIASASHTIQEEDKSYTLHFRYPFERYYMNENKAPLAEEKFRELNQNQDAEAYALVNVKNGRAVLSDVFINGLSVNELN